MLRAGFCVLPTGFGLPQPTASLHHDLLSRRFIVTRGRHGGCARFCRSLCLVIHLRGHFLLVDQLFIAAQIVLRLHVIRFGGFQLSMSCGHLALGRGDGGARVLHSRGGDFQLAGSTYESN